MYFGIKVITHRSQQSPTNYIVNRVKSYALPFFNRWQKIYKEITQQNNDVSTNQTRFDEFDKSSSVAME